jgi:DNA-binding response OmpR family regulator
LMREPGAVLSRFALLEQVWGYEYENRSNVIEVYIRYLRQKIDRPFERDSLQTVRGVGYRICDETQATGQTRPNPLLCDATGNTPGLRTG